MSKLKKISNKSQERRDKVLDQPANRAQKSRENAVKIKRYEEPYFRIIQFECCWESPLARMRIILGQEKSWDSLYV